MSRESAEVVSLRFLGRVWRTHNGFGEAGCICGVWTSDEHVYKVFERDILVVFNSVGI